MKNTENSLYAILYHSNIYLEYIGGIRMIPQGRIQGGRGGGWVYVTPPPPEYTQNTLFFKISWRSMPQTPLLADGRPVTPPPPLSWSGYGPAPFVPSYTILISIFYDSNLILLQNEHPLCYLTPL